MDINFKKVKKNAWRITKKRGLSAIRIRVPGGYLTVKYLDLIRDISQKYGNGTVHMTTRQGFEIPDIPFKDIPAVNQMLQPIIEGLEINQEMPGGGYPAAGTRSQKKYYRLTIMGRTGKRNPRLGEDFIRWIDEESIIRIIANTYKYVEKYIDPDAPGGKEHIGYIVDRTGFTEFKKWALDGVTLDSKAILNETVYWGGVKY
jgi:dissimilatory sulfite reductase (desulfoviridin) alpha/beta subunit